MSSIVKSSGEVNPYKKLQSAWRRGHGEKLDKSPLRVFLPDSFDTLKKHIQFPSMWEGGLSS
jgi:hypothetical protein